MLYGIDVSSHNMNGANFNTTTEQAYKRSDFVICKATQGTGYEFSQCDSIIERALSDNKCVGTYHYASNGNAKSEASYYWNHVKKYNNVAIPVIDFERYQNTNNWNNSLWAYYFCVEYHNLSGVWPMVYVSASQRSRVAKCADKCALWIAGYPTDAASWDVPKFAYKTNPWSTYTVWQYTSGGGVDRNVANLNAKSWRLIARGDNAEGASVTGTAVELAGDVLAGKYGDGDARRTALGNRYDEVQAQVNHVLNASVSILYGEVMKGVYGNGDNRIHNLGPRYSEVQAYINKHM